MALKKKKTRKAKVAPVDVGLKVAELFEAAELCETTIDELEDDDFDHPDLDKELATLEQCYREVLELEPKNLKALTLLGEFFIERGGADDEALVHLERALVLSPADKRLGKLVRDAKKSLAA